MYTPINGWTKERMIQQVKAKNNGKRSVFHNGCAYRSPSGNACAIGCFIPDEKYSEGMEGRGVSSLKESFPGILGDMPLGIIALADFQEAHDNAGKDDNIHQIIENWINQNVKNRS